MLLAVVVLYVGAVLCVPGYSHPATGPVASTTNQEYCG
jgi:hypothetical protein